MLLPWLVPSLLNIEGTHVTDGLGVFFPVSMKQHEDAHLQHGLSTGLRWVLYYKCSNATFKTSGQCGKKKLNGMKQQCFTRVFRLDFSMVELLDIFTPLSAPELSKPSTRRPKTSQRRPVLTAPKPLGRTLLTPGGPYPHYTQQDLEESQILEDIFFIWQRRRLGAKENPVTWYSPVWSWLF